MKKVCPTCHIEKDLLEFNSQGKYCLVCHRERGQAWRIANPEKNRKSQREYIHKIRHPEKFPGLSQYQRHWYIKNKPKVMAAAKRNAVNRHKRFCEFLFSYFSEHHCVDCGESNPLKLCFDHVRGRKLFNISGSIYRYSMKKILSEIRKCDVRCHNCHVLRTATENKHIMWQVYMGVR